MPINSFLYPAKHVPGAYQVANSCRFNPSDNAKLSRSISASPTDPDKFTISFWMKKCGLGNQVVFGNYANANFRSELSFSSDDKLQYYQKNDGSASFDVVLSRQFRDPSAWYHIVFVYDTGQGTDTNRFKFFVNGVHDTSYSHNNPYPAQDLDGRLNQASQTLVIGQDGNDAKDFNGYLAEVVLIDGQALDADQFGEFDSDSGIWKPIDVSGLTFGDDGFYLDFEDSGDLGDDESGNGNDFTESNLAATDQSIDTCTNNHAVGNPLLNYNPVLSEGNLVLTSSGTAWKNSMSTIGVSSGIWYHEVKITAESGVPYQLIGVTDSYHPNSWGASPPNYLGVGALQIGYYNDNGSYYKGDSQTSYGASFGVNDIIGVLLDLDAGTPTIKFYKNDADQGSINLPTSSNSTGLWFFMQSMYISTCSVNYGSPAHAISSGNQDGNGYGNFEYATKGGYTLNTKNLAEFG